MTVVTQNIDTLHQSTRERWDVERQLIEVHGRLGLYHCSSDEGVCHLSTETHATAAQLFPPHVSRAIEQVCDCDFDGCFRFGEMKSKLPCVLVRP